MKSEFPQQLSPTPKARVRSAEACNEEKASEMSAEGNVARYWIGKSRSACDNQWQDTPADPEFYL